MHKLDRKYYSLIDNLINDSFTLFNNFEFLYKIGFTPNMITFISIGFLLLSGYYIDKRQFKIAGLMYAISYYFDCVDGFFARRYKMYSKLGDYLDHGSDIFGFLFIMYLLYKQNPILIKSYFWQLFFLILMIAVQSGCKEKLSNKESSPILGQFKILCTNNNMIKLSSMFGDGGILGLYIAYVIYSFS